MLLGMGFAGLDARGWARIEQASMTVRLAVHGFWLRFVDVIVKLVMGSEFIGIGKGRAWLVIEEARHGHGFEIEGMVMDREGAERLDDGCGEDWY
ncbi:hypothetical protein M0R45_005037 [Rubus argutus]|uniref:Uncharacterized protein n=1 Tax=Rubus argutus TaxID=59490 RepID=A0AAW1YM24_RUBAR